MAQVSAGLLMYRLQSQPEFFLVHPGGPFYKNKHTGAWSIPKGLVDPGEDLLAAAIREFREETGIEPTGPFHELGSARMKSGKTIFAWSFAGEWDPSAGIVSNTFPLEWPPRSGRMIQVPEADKAMWCPLISARELIHPSQLPFLDQASKLLRHAEFPPPVT